MNNENSGSPLENSVSAHNDELLIGSTSSDEASESTPDVSNVSMPEDRPPESSFDVSQLGNQTPQEQSFETSLSPSDTETSVELDTTEHPSASLSDKLGDQIKDVARQQQHNVFKYVDIISEHAQSATIVSGFIEKNDGSKDPFTQLVLDVDHEEIVKFISTYGTNVKLGLPSGHELMASVSLKGDEVAKNQIVVEVPLSGHAADNFFRDNETNPMILQAFDVAFAKEADEKTKNQLSNTE